MRKSILVATSAVAVLGASGEVLAQAARRAPAAPAAPTAARPTAGPAQVVTGPVSTYWVSAETSAGLGAGLSAGGGRPSMGQIMGMMRGASSVNHRLTLQLGSSAAAAQPAADHTPPAGFGLGPKLPLVTPRAAPPAPESKPDEPSVPKEYQRPKGRMLIFWGCGEHARPGQPVVLDFAEMSEGKMPAAALGALKGLNYTPMQPPSPSRSKTYGEWPNDRSRQPIPANSSLVGQHDVAGNYTSPISFNLGPTQDYLPPLGLQTAKSPSGSAQLNWTASPAVRGYLALAIGAGQQDTVALWVSTDAQAAAFGLPDYLSAADVTRLVAQKALMPSGTNSCTVPKEFVDAAPTAFVNLGGYGDEANFSSPARPADPRTPWNIDWTVKVRYRTTESALLGMDMGAMGGGRGGPPPRAGQPQSQQQQQQAPAPSGRDAVMRGLGSALGRGILGGH